MQDERAGSSKRKRRETNSFNQGKGVIRMEIRITILPDLLKNTRDFSVKVVEKSMLDRPKG
jgi:hypothetical protein